MTGKSKENKVRRPSRRAALPDTPVRDGCEESRKEKREDIVPLIGNYPPTTPPKNHQTNRPPHPFLPICYRAIKAGRVLSFSRANQKS